MDKIKVFYEFRILQGNQTLILEKPAQVTFQLIGDPPPLATQCTINNTYNLIGRVEAYNLNFKFPFEVVLNNNDNENDVTIYNIRFSGYLGGFLYVIIKYYQN